MSFDSVELEAFPGRRLRFALGVSVALHAVVLWWSAAPLLTRDTAPALSASLRPALIPVVVPAVLPAMPAASKPTKPQPRVIASTEPVTAVSPAPTFAQEVPAPPAVSVTPVTVAPVANEAPPTVDTADGLRGYRLALATQARRFKRYPPQAMASGWKGTAEIRLELGADGRPLPALITRSSGHESLDRAAQAMIDAGALRASVPDSLRGRAFAVVLPVVFNLDE